MRILNRLMSVCTADLQRKRRLSRSALSRYFIRPAPFTYDEYCRQVSAGPVAVVAGNGPSILRTDFDRLGEFDLIVCNKADRIPQLIERTPKYWVMADPIEDWSDFSSYVLNAFAVAPTDTVFVLSSRNPQEINPHLDPARQVIFVDPKRRLLDDWLNPQSPEALGALRDDRDIFESRHSPMLGIQIALWKGYKTIVLVGCEHDTINAYFEKSGSSDRWVRHAYEESIEEREDIEPMTVLKLVDEVRRTWGMYAALDTISVTMGAVVIDATPEGRLDVFRRLVPH